jgi:DNA-binding beta-propeller fold protein YncE
VAGAALAAGCGGGSSSSNVVQVTVSPSSFTVIVTQTLTLTASVTGSTNTNVTWMCTYATTTVDSSGKTSTGTSTPCSAATGTIPANSTNTTVVYTAPQSVPDATKLPGNNCTVATQPCQLVITITATSAADTKKTGTASILLDSGIAVGLTPTTATVPTSSSASKPSNFQFTATITNDTNTKGVTWLITQATPTSSVPYPKLATCSPTCGTIDQNGLYSAPTAVPTTATLTIVVFSNADDTRLAIGTITIITGGPIKFKGISPTIVPQGVAFYDIYLEAPGVTSASQVFVTGDTSGQQQIPPAQLKVLFPIPTSSTPAPASTGFRVRLLASNLSAVDTFTVAVTDPSQPFSNPGPGPYRFSVVPVRPTSVASLPDSIVQNAQGNELEMIVNGGYFGPNGSFVGASFQGAPIPFDTSSNVTGSNSRQLLLAFPSNIANSAQPGLYPFSVARTAAPAPAENNPAITNLGIFPDYKSPSFPPYVNNASSIATGFGGALTNASAIDIDPELGVAIVAVTGGNRVEFFKIGRIEPTLSLTPVACPVASCAVNVPTGLSVNRALHTVAVVSMQDQSVTVFPIPGASPAPVVPTAPISLAGLIPAEQSPLPLPYSIAVDPDSNQAIVAYSSTANPTTAKVGFLLDLNIGDSGSGACLSNKALTVSVSPCVHAQVTLNTGQFPQIAMLPHNHLAVVTPGGLGVTTGIDVTKASASVLISNVSLTSGLVTVTTTTAHGLNPGNPGTVLILNVPKGSTNNVDFNGAFTVQSVINSTSFTYALNSTVNDTAAGITQCPPSQPNCDPNTFSTAFYSRENITIGGLAQTTQGVAVNPITGLVATADANATGQNGAQISLLSLLDQNISSITFRADCTVNTQTCSGAPELLGTTSVSFQPFSNSLVSYNAAQNQVSVSNPVNLDRAALVCINSAPTCNQDIVNNAQVTLPGSGTATICVTPTIPPAPPVPSTAPPCTSPAVALPLFGGLAVDPATNQAIVVQSGSGTIQLIDLGKGGSSVALKKVHITEVLVPSAAPGTIGGILNASFPQGTLSSPNPLSGVKIFGTGLSNSPIVHLDGIALPAPTVVSDRELTVAIPASFLKHPHRYALDVVAGGVQSNASDFIVVTAVDLSSVCKDSTGTTSLTHPSSVAVADQIGLNPYAPTAVVSNTGCNSISVIDIAPQLPTYDNGNPLTGHLTGFADNTNFGNFKVIPVGSGPTGVAISPRLGYAVVANNTAGTASIVNLITGLPAAADVTTGSGPTGVAVNEATLAALVANTSSNTVSEIDLAAIASNAAPVNTIGVDTEPIAIAIDQDRGTNNLGLAVVTALRLNSSTFPSGVLDSVDIGAAIPAKSTTAAVGSVSTTPTGVVFDPSVSPALFYAVSSGGNVVSSFNPDTGAASTVHVGINPTSLALNPQTGGIMTLNSISNTISIIDTLTSPFKTRRSYGIPGSPTLGVAIDQFLNLAVIVDQAHNRVLLFPMPN